MPKATHNVEAIRWDGQCLSLLDQRRLPDEELWLSINDVDGAIAAIADLVVRGAPAIGIAAAYAAVLAARRRGADHAGWAADLERIGTARPTAVNLRWALAQMRRQVAPGAAPGNRADVLEAEARAIHDADLQANARMAELGAALIEPGASVLTHCNTGSLATGGIGTALGVIVRAWRDGRIERVHACETRPWLQGLRLTAWEFDREGVPCSLLVEGAAATLMQRGGVDWVITGADRITANGDVANKIGTLMLATLARQFGARFMVVAPVSTLDADTPDGSRIAIEERGADELWSSAGIITPPPSVSVFNPVFDVTPADLVDVIVTEHGVLEAPLDGRVGACVRAAGATA